METANTATALVFDDVSSYGLFEMQGVSKNVQTDVIHTLGTINCKKDKFTDLVVLNLCTQPITLSNIPCTAKYFHHDCNKLICSTEAGGTLIIPGMNHMIPWIKRMNGLDRNIGSITENTHILIVLDMPPALEIESLRHCASKFSDMDEILKRKVSLPTTITHMMWQQDVNISNFSTNQVVFDKLKIEDIPCFTDLIKYFDIVTPLGCSQHQLTTILSEWFGTTYFDDKRRKINYTIDLPPFIIEIPSNFVSLSHFSTGMLDVSYGSTSKTISFTMTNYETKWKLTFFAKFSSLDMCTKDSMTNSEFRKSWLSQMMKTVNEPFNPTLIYNMVKLNVDDEDSMTEEMLQMWNSAISHGYDIFTMAFSKHQNALKINPPLPNRNMPPPPSRPHKLVRMQSCVPP